MDNYKVYMHICPNGKKYVGITRTSLKRRWGHNGYGYRWNPHFYRAINLYGWDNIEHKVLCEGLKKKEAEEMEIRLIKENKLTDKRYGYNIENGGNAPGTHSIETLKKMSEAQLGPKNHMYGRKGMLSPNYKRHPSPEAIEKNRLAHIGKPSYWKGKNITDHMKKRISEAQSKKVIFVETQQVFESIGAAAESVGVSLQRVSQVVRHKKRAQTAGGYHWEYYKEVT